MKNIKLKKFIIYILSVVIIILTSIIIMISFFSVQGKIQKQIYKNYIEQLEELTSQVINTIFLEIEYSVHILERISECKNLQTKPTEERLKYLKEIKRKGHFTSLGIIDKDGNAYDIDGHYWKIERSEILKNLRTLKNGNRYYVSDVLPNKEKHTKEILIAIPLHRGEILFGDYPVLEISDEMTASDNQQYFQLTDTNGNYISTSLNKKYFVNKEINLWEEIKKYKLFDNFSISTLKENMKNNKKGVFYFEYEDEGRYVIYQPLGINKWYIFSVFTKNELNSRANEFQKIAKELLIYLIFLKIILVFIIVGMAIYIYTIIKFQSKKLEVKNKIFEMLANKTKDLFFEINLNKETFTIYDFSEEKSEVINPIEDFYPENMFKAGKINNENYNIYVTMYKKFLNKENIENQIVQFKRNNEWKWFRVNSVFFNNETFVGILEDCTNEKEKEVEFLKISEKSKYDFLTGLYNRETFEQEFNYFLIHEQNKDSIAALFIIDLDNFKEINDVFGHRLGDKVLRETAHTLKTTLRSSDILGRLGGDEFILLIKDAPDIEAIKKIAHKINLALIKTYSKDNKNITVSCSIGIKILKKGMGFKKSYEGADLALYHVKYNGRNSYYINKN